MCASDVQHAGVYHAHAHWLFAIAAVRSPRGLYDMNVDDVTFYENVSFLNLFLNLQYRNFVRVFSRARATFKCGTRFYFTRQPPLPSFNY